VFQHLASGSRMSGLKSLIVAPFMLHRRMMEHVHAATAAARAGRPARIVLKMNALTDEPLGLALAQAGRAGVAIDLIVRGACVVPADRPGLSDNVHVRSIIGRFLEHSRVFYFENAGEPEMFCASADWMERNFYRRVEVAFPLRRAAHRERILADLETYLKDDCQAWELKMDGRYVHVQPQNETLVNAQAQLLAAYMAASTLNL